MNRHIVTNEIAGEVSALGGMVGAGASASYSWTLESELHKVRDKYPDRQVILSFRIQQAAVIKLLQHDIVELVESHGLRKAEDNVTPDRRASYVMISEKLQQYAQALRDYDTLSEETIPLAYSEPGIRPWDDYSLQFRELGRDQRIRSDIKKAFRERLIVGAFGGLALIGPMILMVLRQDWVTSLITSCVATIIFVIVMSVSAKDAKGKDMLGATAGYAAVLVVFVGTSLAPSR